MCSTVVPADYGLFNLGPVVGALVVVGALIRTVLWYRERGRN
jgi:hypothetical protein